MILGGQGCSPKEGGHSTQRSAVLSPSQGSPHTLVTLPLCAFASSPVKWGWWQCVRHRAVGRIKDNGTCKIHSILHATNAHYVYATRILLLVGNRSFVRIGSGRAQSTPGVQTTFCQGPCSRCWFCDLSFPSLLFPSLYPPLLMARESTHGCNK